MARQLQPTTQHACLAMNHHHLVMQAHRRARADKHARRHAPRHPWQPREKAALIMLRRLGYTIPTLRHAFHRSSSTIHAILRRHRHHTQEASTDYRKLPHQLRQQSRRIQRARLARLWRRWVAFITGEEDEPP